MLPQEKFASAGWVVHQVATGDLESARRASPSEGGVWAQVGRAVETATRGEPANMAVASGLLVRRLGPEEWWVRCPLWRSADPRVLGLQGRIRKSETIPDHFEFVVEGAVPMDASLPGDVADAEPDALEQAASPAPNSTRRPVASDESAACLPTSAATVVREVVNALVALRWQRFREAGGTLDATPADYERAIHEANQAFVPLPEGFQQWAYAQPLDDGTGWWVECPVWTRVGVSDWQMSGRLRRSTDEVGYEFEVREFLIP